MTSQWPAESQDAEETVPQISRDPEPGDFGALWQFIENGLDRIMFECTWGVDIPSLARLYTAVHDYCTQEKGEPPLNSSDGVGGKELYESCAKYLHQYLGKLKQSFESLSGQILLDRYLDECAHYTNAAQIVHYVFRYLNRHFVKAELDKGKSIFDIFTLHLVLWHGELFKEISRQLVDAVFELVEKHRKGEIMELGASNALIEFIVSLGFDGMNLSSPIRDVYGSLLETPLRIIIEEFGCTSRLVFLYKRPLEAPIHRGGPPRTEMEERLTSLILRSGFKQAPADGSHDICTVRLAAKDLTVIEVDQKAAECSFLIRHLCAYFGKGIVNKEVIPLPGIAEPVLRKVLEWCEHHKNDPNTNANCAEHYRGLDMDEWDQKYFEFDQEMLFDVIVAANYLDIAPLLDIGCKTVAHMIKGRSAHEIRNTFNLTNDFTAEEEEQILRENEWAEDRGSASSWTDMWSSFPLTYGSISGTEDSAVRAMELHHDWEDDD